MSGKLAFLMLCVVAIVSTSAFADSLDGLSDVTVVDGQIISFRYEGTEYAVEDEDLMLGTTTRWYIENGVETLWIEGDPAPADTVSGTSNAKAGDVGSKADNFSFTVNGATNISSIDGIDFQETIFSLPTNLIFVFERNGNDNGTVQAIKEDGSLGQALTLTSGGQPYASTGVNVNGQTAHGYVLITDEPVIGIRITASGHDSLSISTPTQIPLWASKPSPPDGSIQTLTWTSLNWRAGSTAVSHDVYISDNFEDVNDRSADVFQGNMPAPPLIVGFIGFPIPDGLAPGTTYYWAVDEVEADGTTKHKGSVWSFSIPSRLAHNPMPSDGAKFVDLDMELSWTAGLDAKVHSVIFGDNFDDVNNAAAGSTSGETTFSPGTLEADKTYYWRVDELNPPTTVKGKVWSFTTLPVIPITDPDLIAWWTFDEGSGAKALDWSGHENHVILFGSEWVDGKYGDSGLKIGSYGAIENLSYAATDLTGVTVAGWIRTSSSSDQYIVSFDRNEYYRLEINGSGGGPGQVGWDVMTSNGQIDYGSVRRVDDGSWHHVAGVYDRGLMTIYIDGVAEPSTTGGATYGSGNTRFGFIGANSEATGFDGNRGGGAPVSGEVDDIRIYNKALTQQEIEQVMRLDLRLAWSPTPADGSMVGINQVNTLNWTAGNGASRHDVYFGTDIDAVKDADVSDTTGVYVGRQNSTSYIPSGITMGSGLYYWRVDEVANDGTIVEAPVWSFSVTNFISVEDFDAYNDIEEGQPDSNLVYLTWLDGFGIPTNGSTMGYTVPFEPTMESGEVHSVQQSAPMGYNNTGTAASSEVTRTFTPAQNWTTNGVTKLTLWFFGDPANTAGQLYVKINGVQVNYDGDAANLSIAQWHQWDIDLTSIGTNLQSVTSMAVGVQGAGATGILLLDDIRLYP